MISFRRLKRDCNCRSDSIKKASGFVQKLKSDLPIIGLVSKLTSPTGVQEEAGMVR